MCIMYVYTHFFQHSKLLRKMPQLINLIFIDEDTKGHRDWKLKC